MKDAWILLEWIFWLGVVLLLDPPTFRKLRRTRKSGPPTSHNPQSVK